MYCVQNENYRIQCGIEVTQPKEERGDTVADAAGFAQWHGQCHDKEGQPADDKGSSDNGQCFGCLALTFRLQCLLALVHLLHGIRNARQLLLWRLAQLTVSGGGGCWLLLLLVLVLLGAGLWCYRTGGIG